MNSKGAAKKAAFPNREHVLTPEGAEEVRRAFVGPKTVKVELKRIPQLVKATSRGR